VSTTENAQLRLLDAGTARAARAAGSRLLGAAGLFLFALVCAVVGQSTSGIMQAEDEAAARLGVNPNALPVDVLAEIHRGESWVGAALVALPFLAGAVLLFLGVRSAARTATGRYRATAAAATALAAVSALAWAYVQVAGPFYVEPVQRLVLPAVIASTAAGCAALGVLAIVVRGSGIARRTSAVVAALAAAATVGAFFVVPPFAPYVLAAVLAPALVRTPASPTM
jgi:hypothetical protein